MPRAKSKRNKNHIIVLITMVIAVIGLGVALAALSTTLNINGTAKIQAASWDVYWSSMDCTPSGMAELDTNQISPDGYQLDQDVVWNDTADVAAIFRAPGDKVVCELDAENDGTIDAKISGLTSDLSQLSQDNISAALMIYGSTTPVKDGDPLLAGDTAYYSLTLTYNGTTLSPTDKAQRKFSFKIPFVQAN
ncbi:MAG: hypothetical protein LBM73_00395 [Candidatus Nomurabacteria bacterium]|jgi:hypothetical protein|nr:hypothetical protein [Candidatus Nomurabacteria bacterium]